MSKRGFQERAMRRLQEEKRMGKFKFGFTGFKTVEETMGEKKYVVPEGGLQAGRAAYSGYVTAKEGARRIITAFIRWQSENQPHPTDKEFVELIVACRNEIGKDKWENSTEWMRAGMLCHGWLRRMYLAPEPEVPEEIKDLLSFPVSDSTRELITEAYRRGQISVTPQEELIPQELRDMMDAYTGSKYETLMWNAIMDAYRIGRNFTQEEINEESRTADSNSRE